MHEEHSRVLEDKKALAMNSRNEIHAHKEAIVGHIKDKEYLDSRLAQARDAHAEMLAKHDAMSLELKQAKAAHKAKVLMRTVFFTHADRHPDRRSSWRSS